MPYCYIDGARHRFLHIPCTQGVQRVFSWLHSLMVVHVSAAPELLFPMVYDIANDRALLATSSVASGVTEVHDRARVLLFWSLIPAVSKMMTRFSI